MDGMSSFELENIRRSLAMAPTLPEGAARALLNEVIRLRRQVADLLGDDPEEQGPPIH